MLVLAVTVSAQTVDKPTHRSSSRIPLRLSEGNGAVFDAGVGVALEHRFTPRWSMELEAAREVHDYQPSFFDPTVIEFLTYPVDGFVRYSIQTTNVRWRPFLGAGARYVSAPNEPAGAQYDSELSPEIGAGDSLSIVFDAKALAQNDVPHWDELLKVSVGVGWRF
jgi:outer membrane protein W